MPEALTALAPAEVNLVLEVTGRRDDGYHEIDTVLQTLELADSVTLSFGGSTGIEVSGPFSAGTPTDESNLAWRAAAELARLARHTLDGLSIGLEKRIPAAGGLGGGASDAATVLRLLQRAWGAKAELLFEAANAIGSDEAFFLLGGTARARGRGERVTELPDLHRHGVVVFIPPFTIERKTQVMFQALDALPFDGGDVSQAFAAREPHALSSGDVFNAFERVVFDVFPQLADLWEQLERLTGDPIRLAGAGPTLFWIGHQHLAAEVAVRARTAACTVIQTATARSLWKH